MKKGTLKEPSDALDCFYAALMWLKDILFLKVMMSDTWPVFAHVSWSEINNNKCDGDEKLKPYSALVAVSLNKDGQLNSAFCLACSCKTANIQNKNTFNIKQKQWNASFNVLAMSTLQLLYKCISILSKLLWLYYFHVTKVPRKGKWFLYKKM